MGGTDVVIKGNHFLPDSKVTFDGVLMFPDGGIFVDEGTLSGHAPAHPSPGRAKVEVRSSIGISAPFYFEYAPGPVLTAIDPATVSATGGDQVTVLGKNLSNARIYFGDDLASAVPFTTLIAQSEAAVRVTVPPGRGRTTVWALDPDLGYDKLTLALTWSTP
jgi:hypothetical protein